MSKENQEDTESVLYLVEGFHQIHCLVSEPSGLLERPLFHGTANHHSGVAPRKSEQLAEKDKAGG
jgi:hypothetical protein